MTPGHPMADAQAAKSAAFDAWPEAAFIIDSSERISSANEAAEQLLGRALGGRGSLASVVQDGSPLRSLIERCLDEGTAVRAREMEILVPGPTRIVADAGATPWAMA